MANYQDTVNYFETLSVQHYKILHTATSKKFYRVSIEEFLNGSVRELPNYDAGPCLVLINYIKDIGVSQRNTPNDTQQIMFFVLQGFGVDNFNEEETARNNCEDTVDEILVRMRKDSQEGHAFFNYSYDVINRTRKIPAEIKTPSGIHVGWQVSIYLERPFAKCYDANKWIIPAT